MARKMTNYEMVQILNNLKLFENKKLQSSAESPLL